jgi:hypothetical protein
MLSREALAQADHQVRLLHLVQQRLGHADAHVAAVVGMVGVEQMRAAMRRADRQGPGLGEAREVRQRLVPAGSHRTADQHQRALGIGEHLGELVEVVAARPRLRQGGGLHHRPLGGQIEDVLGQDDGDRARRPGLREVEGAGDHLARLDRLHDLEHALGHVGQQAGVVLFLQRAAADVLALDMADQCNQRRCVVIGSVQRDHRVGHAGPAGDEHDAGAPVAHPPVGGGHEARAALMPADHEADARHVGQRIGQAEIGFARHAVDDVDIVCGEALGQEAADGAGHGAFLIAVGDRRRGPAARRPRVRHG